MAACLLAPDTGHAALKARVVKKFLLTFRYILSLICL